MRRLVVEYGGSLVVLVVAVAIRWVLDLLLRDELALITMYGAVAFAVWIGGILPAILIVVLGYLACAYLFIDPRGSLGLDVPRNYVGLLAYLATCFLIIVFAVAMRVAQRRSRAQAEALRAKFASIGDAIITTDTDGNITYLNAVAEKLTGWKNEQAVGKPLASVFKIINEQSRRPVENPVAKVLASGHIVGLANHTVLVCRDGTERPVDDSAAPVRDANGDLTGVVRDITERKKAESQLKDADRRKDEFLATLAHELRNPLAPIRNALEIMKLSDSEQVTVQHARDTIDRQLAHLVRFVDDLIDVSRITRDKLDLRTTCVELASIVHQAVETCRPLAESENQVIDVVLPDEPIYLEADPVRLAQIFSNLLNNACKYTQKRETIRIAAERRDGVAVVSVKDSGIGIAPEMLPRVFDMFTQLDRSLERSQGGLGIGLTLVRRLVEMHGGTVDALSEGLGKGSEFVVQLPIPVETPTHDTQQPMGAKRPPTAQRFLVVDDNQDSAKSLAMLLKMTGNETHTAHDGLAAVEAAEKFRPDVVVLDIGLPKMNGYDVCRTIREQSWGKDVVMVALTGWGQPDDRRKSKEAGFDGHLVKPVDYNALADLLAELQRSPA